MTTAEIPVRVESVRVFHYRNKVGVLAQLGESIRAEGLHRPIGLWKDGTLFSGERRYRACILLGRKEIPAVFVDTIEDAAKLLIADRENDYLARPMTASDICHLWDVLRRLDRPAAIARADAHRRRGVELRRQTQDGKREPGRAGTRTEDYVLSQVAPAFGMSVTTASRLWRIYELGQASSASRRAAAQEALADVDSGASSISASYQKLTATRPAHPVESVAVAPPVAIDKQVAVWNRALPQMEGLVAGLAELGPPNASLTWDQVGPVHDRLMKIRRDMEKIIKKMRESNQS